MRLRLVILLFFAATFSGKANLLQKSPIVKPMAIKKSIALKTDSSIVEWRKFNETEIQKLSKQEEFIYDDVAPDSLSWWDRFWRWVWDLINKLFSGKISGGIIKYALIAILIVVVVFIAIKLVGLDYKFLTGKSKAVTIPFEESLENIHEIDFDEQIEKALASSNYRLIVRLLYLKTLKQLSDQELINWQPEKTNQAYVSELENENQRNQFAKLTNQFEYVWYGEFFIDKSTFEAIDQSFKQFNQKTA